MSGANGPVQLSMRGLTDVGRHREHNEDAFLLAALGENASNLTEKGFDGPLPDEGLLFVVADGMGGAAAGEVASRMAVESLFDQLRDGFSAEAEAESVERALESAVSEANSKIWAASNHDTKHRGMGTTVTAAVAWRETLFVAQVGDSRGYLLRRQELVQLTKDQSLINQLIEDGTLTPEEAEKIGGKNIILQALGVDEAVKTDMRRLDLLDGDQIMLCSDGLTGMIDDGVVRDVMLSTASDLGRSCKALVDHANEGGGRDNITVIVGRFEGGGLRPPTDDDGQPVVSQSSSAIEPPKRIDPRLLGGLGGIVLIVVLFLLFTGGKTSVVVHFRHADGSTLNGVSVTLVGPDETIERELGEDDQLELADAEPGTWKIRASRPGYEPNPYEAEFDVVDGESKELKVTFTPNQRVVRVTVNGVSDATVELARADGTPEEGVSAFLRSKGRFALVVRRRGYKPHRRVVDVDEGEGEVAVDVTLEEAIGTLLLTGVRPGSTLTASEVVEGTVPLKNVRVEAGKPIALREGRYSIEIDAPLFERYRAQNVEIVSDGETKLEVDQRKPKGTISVEVDRGKHPDVNQAEVFSGSGESKGLILLTDGTGEMKVPEGSYTVRLSDGTERPVEVTAGSPAPVVFK